MVTLGMRRLESAAAIAAALVLAVITSPLVAQSLSADDRELEQIQEILSRGGPYSLDLLGPLSRLGLIYQEGEDYALALVTLERAQHIVRVNNGLHSMDQVPLMRQLIAVEDARGNHEGAWDRQQDLLELLRRHPDDVRTVPVLRDIADRQMEVLAAVIAGERPPEVVLGCFYKQWPTQADGSCEAGSKSTVVQGMLAEAQRTYLEAIAVLLRQGLYDSDDLRAIEVARQGDRPEADRRAHGRPGRGRGRRDGAEQEERRRIGLRAAEAARERERCDHRERHHPRSHQLPPGRPRRSALGLRSR